MHRLRSVQLLLDLTHPCIMTLLMSRTKKAGSWSEDGVSRVSDMIRDPQSIYYSSTIAENKGNQKVLFQAIDQLLQRKQEPLFPASTSSERLANEFFHEKISKMRCSFYHDSDSIINPIPDLSCCQSELTNDIRESLVSSGVKTCALDPLPSMSLR